MKKIAILDPQWGDCGKGRVTHYFSPNYDFIVRSNGANNCGHVVYRNGKKYVHHLLPSADYRNTKTRSYLSSGMAIDLDALLQEVSEANKDFPGVGESIYVDTSAFVISQENIETDKEKNKHIGSTNKGVGPAYTDKVSRQGKRIYHHIQQNDGRIEKLKALGIKFTSILALREEFINSSIIFEGAQSVLLDINAGPDYPFVTSSDCTVSSIASAGFNFITLDEVFGVMKPYVTKVGNGNFPTEIFGDEAAHLQKIGGEVGSSTGRTRRVGYLDLPALKYAVLRGGITSLIISKMDILERFEEVKIATSYGRELLSPEDFINPNIKYESIPGWKDSKNLDQTSQFIKMVQDYTNRKVKYLSCGVSEKDIISL